MNDHVEKLGRLQQEILKHIIECENEEILDETVSHIAQSLSRKQPTIFKSVKTLIKYHYLDFVKYDTPYYGNNPVNSKTGGTKDLIVTAKGAAAAIVLGVNVDRLEKYVNYSFNNDSFRNYRLKKYLYYIKDHHDDYKEKYPQYLINLNSIDHDDFAAKIVNPHETTAMILGYVRRIAEPHHKLDLIIKKAMMYALENNYFEEEVTKRLTADQIGKLQLFIALQHLDALGDILTLKEFVNKYGIDKNFLKKHLIKRKEYINLAIKELGRTTRK